MQQILNFVIKHRNTLLFLFLLSISLGLTIQSHSFHKSKFISSTNFVSGNVYEATSSISNYFHLKKYNERLLNENAKLKNQLEALGLDTLNVDSFKIDSIGKGAYKYIAAEVINNTCLLYTSPSPRDS